MTTNKQEFLAQLPLFKALTDDELAVVAEICQEFEFVDGAVVAYQRDVADSLYIVRQGRLFAKTVDNRGIARESRAYMPGDYFGEEWLFDPTAHPATVRGSGNGRLLMIKGTSFLQFLNENPQALPAFEPELDQSGNPLSGLSSRAWEEAQKMKRQANRRATAVSLLADELIEYYAHRSRYYLLLQLLGPIFLLILTPLITGLLLPFRPATGFVRNLFLIIPSLVAVGALLWMAFNYIDWINDYFVITNKHLVHREFNLRNFRTSTVKISIDKIQSVEVEKPTFLSNLLNFGTARITTAAQAGMVRFANIDDPLIVKDTLNRLSQRVRSLDAGREQAVMRSALEGHFQASQPMQPVKDSTPPPAPKPATGWQAFTRRYRWRVEEGNVITYRKHIFILLQQIVSPIAVLIGIFILYLLLGRFFLLPLSQYWYVIVLFVLLDLAWLVWRVEDWRNDTFQLTDRLIIDIDRKPFGFGEVRKQAPFSNIQNVNAARPGLLPTLFNYGDVYVETAGSASNITFERVPNPSQIQSDIFKRLDDFRQAERVKEGAQRRKEYAVLMDVYQQAQEQGRLPRRTPLPEEFAPDTES